MFLSGYSRLLIDCNRPPGTPTSIPPRSEATSIPGNEGITAAERSRRQALYFEPFRALVAAELDRRAAQARPTILLGVHSFTPVFHGVQRPWQAGLLYDRAAAFSQQVIAGLAAGPALCVGDNQPYQIEPEHDYTVPVHGDGRAIPAALLEIRQDLLQDSDQIAGWAARLAPVLSACAAHARPPRAG